MHEPRRLTDGTTYYWGHLFPAVWSICMGVVVALIWTDALGEGPAPAAVKWAALGMWGGLTTLFFRLFGRMQEVWLDGNEVVVGDPLRGTRIHLQDIREVKESRLSQVKMVTLKLARPTPLGDSVTFIPGGMKTFLFPLATSPVAEELRERVEALVPCGEGERSAGRLKP